MSNRRNIALLSFAIWLNLTLACSAISPAVLPTMESTAAPTMTTTLENTPFPTVTPTRSPTSTPSSAGGIDVGGYKLNYECFGQGSPAVIVEAGGGDKPTVSFTWSAVVEVVQTTTRICIYNRVPGVRTSQDIAEDLHFLLSQIPVPGPYILVAHSLGGYHARVFTHQYPDEVVGLVLVDTTPPTMAIAYATAYPTYSPDESPAVASNRITDVSAFPTPDIDGLDFNASTEQVLQAGSLGDLPLVVISANHGPEDWTALGFALEDAERMSAAFLKVQSEMATLSSKGVFIVANTSHHFVSSHDPQTVIDAITQMVEQIRNP